MKREHTSVAVILGLGLALLGPVRSVDAQLDPCALLTVAEVRQAFPGSKPGSIERGLEKQGILRCSWESPAGRLFLIASEEAEDSVRDEAATWAESALDPLQMDAKRHLRFEAVAGVGDKAIAVVERQDRAKSILQDAALIVVRRGKWEVSLLAPQLARRERPDALRLLTDLGKSVAGRLR